ncbi:DNA-directed RNA polymerase subunit alpha, partial [Candidatus Microgenomates bacterium]|nr:DNA-directed RNA polymerase subunit alpha [Candidatus Microgenomates bacterium]
MRNPSFKIEVKTAEQNYGKFVIEPLNPGFGHTLGNALRRVLLTGLPGAAVTSVKIDGIRHQFSTLPGLKEDISELILNIKNLRLKLEGERATIKLLAYGPGEVRADKIETPSEVEIINKELYLGSLSDK